MGAKSLIMLHQGAAFALEECVSKNQALDLIADLARGELGEQASDIAVLAWIEQRIGPVARARNDRPPRITARYNRMVEASARYAATPAGKLRVFSADGDAESRKP